MADHITSEVADDLATVGSDTYIEQYMKRYGSSHSTHVPNFHGFKNNMKIQCDWHQTRQRLKAKLEGKRLKSGQGTTEILSQQKHAADPFP